MVKTYTLTDADETVIYTDAGDINVSALGGNDTITANITGIAVLSGGDGDDLLTGGNGNDTLTGGSGNDSLLGGSGNDIMDGGSGTDILTGGIGDDTYFVNDGNETITENLNEGTDTVKTALATYVLDNNVEVLVGTAATAQTLTGNSLDNLIKGGSGDDSIDGSIGNDSMSGGLGDDSYFLDSAGDTVTELASSGIDTVRTSLVNYTLEANVENLRTTGTAASHNFIGNSLGNTITGGTLNDIIDGGAGNDAISGGTGADAMTGGTGDDTFTVDNAGDTVTEAANEGSDTVKTNLTTYTLGSDVENLTGTKGGGGQTLTGNALNNSFSDNATGNTFIGGAGDDSYVVDNAGDVVTENASDGTDIIKTSIATYTLVANVETLWGTLVGGGQTLTGNGLDNLLTDDGAANTLRGGLGNDTYVINSAGDVVAENLTEGIDSVQTALAAYALTANVENLQGTGTAAQSLTGNGLDNLILGGAFNDTLDGGIGNDTMTGGAGDDIYVVDVLADTVNEGANQGTDTIQTNLLSYTLISNVEKLVGTAAGGGQTLTGNAANNTFSDQGAANTMVGAAGNDIYLVDNAGDVLTENLNEGTDTVQTVLTTYTLGANLENLSGTLLIGGQTLIGNALANSFSDNAVASTMQGAAGNDKYVFDNVGDIIIEQLSEGTDTVTATITGYTLGANLENLILGGTASTGTGNALNNIITGNATGNTLSGLDGNDMLVGGGGRDFLSGGNGKDIFDFNTVVESGKTLTTRDTITDFAHLSDKMDLKTIDASTKLTGDQVFKFIGTAVFHKVAGELHYLVQNPTGTINDKTIVEGDTNGDGKFDFQIELSGLKVLSALDFVL
jgi:serralysin